jgi:hypothetical protein
MAKRPTNRLNGVFEEMGISEYVDRDRIKVLESISNINTGEKSVVLLPIEGDYLKCGIESQFDTMITCPYSAEQYAELKGYSFDGKELREFPNSSRKFSICDFHTQILITKLLKISKA